MLTLDVTCEEVAAWDGDVRAPAEFVVSGKNIDALTFL